MYTIICMTNQNHLKLDRFLSHDNTTQNEMCQCVGGVTWARQSDDIDDRRLRAYFVKHIALRWQQ